MLVVTGSQCYTGRYHQDFKFLGKYNKQAGNLFFSYESSGEHAYVAGGNPRPRRLMTATVTDSNVPSENIWGRVSNQPS